MKVRKFSLVVTDEEGNRVAEKEITTQWVRDDEEKLRKFHGLNIESEIATMLSYEIKKCLTPEFVREII